MRSRMLGVLALAASAVFAGVVASPAQAGVAASAAASAPAPYCGIHWGSLPKTGVGAPGSGVGPMTNVRAGQHDCFDRVVIDLRGAPAGYDVRYVTTVVDQGRGDVVSLRGGAFLDVTLRTGAYDPDTGSATYSPADRAELVAVGGWQTLRQLAWGGSFEATTTIGVGVRARLPFRVFALAGPGAGSRLVIDVAHRW